MKRIIMIKYGELTTKKSNRNLFIKTLTDDLEYKLKDIDHTITSDLARMFIEFNENDYDKVINKIDHVFGIHGYTVVIKVDSNVDSIKESIKNIINNFEFNTFKIETKRSDKNFPINSLEFSKMIGGVVLKNKKCSVDVHHPDIIFNIEIRKDYTYIYCEDHDGIGGYPLGVAGKGLLMLSGGIDSPVAGYMAMKRGVKVDAIYFEAIPHTSLEARNKVINLTKKLCEYGNKVKLTIVPFTELQEAIYKNVQEEYVITIMRRMMYRIMERLTKRYKAHVIINGESIGQVASQTLTSMEVINNVTNVPVIRPVACLDKLEIMAIAKKIDTYDISILPFEDCCTIFVPRHPVINPILDKCIEMEKSFNYEEMIDSIMHNLLVLNINNEEENKYEDLL